MEYMLIVDAPKRVSLAFIAVQILPSRAPHLALSTLKPGRRHSCRGGSSALSSRLTPLYHIVSMNLLGGLLVIVVLVNVEGNPECDQAREKSTACQAKYV